MALLGVQSVVYGVDDLARCTQFYVDFGLDLTESDERGARFVLAEGSEVVLRRNDDPALPPRFTDLPGAREIVWGVDSPSALDRLQAELGRDRPVRRDADGTLHGSDPNGIAIAFRVFDRKPIAAEADAVNSLGEPVRLNRHRAWYRRAAPRLIHHVVFGVPDVDAAQRFYTERLGFRVSDVSRGLGVFFRCDGRRDHHNLFFLNSPKVAWHHVSFGVENIDELMTGANHMQRRGWASDLGIGRHRIASSIFYYVNNPAGGRSEYTSDTDYVDDSWRPRLWDAKFGNWFWVGRWPEGGGDAPEWDSTELPQPVPPFSSLGRRP